MAATPRPKDSLVRAIFPGLEYREAAEGSKPTLTGHFSVFNQWTTIRSSWEGNFLERVAPGAFKKTIAENRNNIRVLLNHGKDPQIGDKPIGKITELREDGMGAYYEVEVFDGIDPLVMEGLRAEQYGASMRFRIMMEHWVENPKRSDENPEGLPERTIKEAGLAEFGPVTFPAYAGATAGIRSEEGEAEFRSCSMTDQFQFDNLTLNPEILRELLDTRRSRTVVTSAPNARVTFTSRGQTIEENPKPKVDSSPLEERMDLDDLSLLTAMARYGQWYIDGQDEDDDPGNVTKMQAIIDSMAVLVKVEADEPAEPADDNDAEDLFYSADKAGEERTEPESSETTTPVEPEPSGATTRAVTTKSGLIMPTFKTEARTRSGLILP